jgi:hypothetical protein
MAILWPHRRNLSFDQTLEASRNDSIQRLWRDSQAPATFLFLEPALPNDILRRRDYEKWVPATVAQYGIDHRFVNIDTESSLDVGSYRTFVENS